MQQTRRDGEKREEAAHLNSVSVCALGGVSVRLDKCSVGLTTISFFNVIHLRNMGKIYISMHFSN